jgi:hypothetical protein
MILQALREAHKDGGAAYLKDQALKNPTAFLGLVGKVLPLDVNNKHSGDVRIVHVPVPKTALDE